MTKMNKAKLKLISCAALSIATIAGLFVVVADKPVLADAYEGAIISTSGDVNSDTLKNFLGSIVALLIYGIGAAAMLGFVVSGVIYLTARDNPQQVQKAKTRLIEVTIGLIAWTVIFAFANWLVPGGISISLP